MAEVDQDHPNGNVDTPSTKEGLPVFGNVFAWGQFSDGAVVEVEAAQGARISQLISNPETHDVAAIMMQGVSRLQWLVTEEGVGGPPTMVDRDAVDIADQMLGSRAAIGRSHAALVTEDGSLFTWGSNSRGQRGLGHLSEIDEPELVMKLERQEMKLVACGREHTVVTTVAGDVYTFGRAMEGQTGQEMRNAKARALSSMATNFQPAPRYVAGLQGVAITAIACGPLFTVAISSMGGVWSWGEGLCGQLGYGRCTSQKSPKLVMHRDGDDGTPFQEVCCGLGHVLARSAAGNVWVWGFNAKGQLGLGDTTSRFTPALLQKQQLAHSKSHRHVQEASRTIGSAGNATMRQLGPPRLRTAGSSREGKVAEDAASRPRTPLDIAAAEAAEDARLMSPGHYLAASVQHGTSTADMSMDNLPADIGSTLAVPAPQATWGPSTPRLKAVSIAAGLHHSAAVTAEGELFTWGSAEGGRLGHPDRTATVFNGDIETTIMLNCTYPTRVQALASRKVASVTCGSSVTVAVASPVLEEMHPANGYTSGGTTLSFRGVGLATLAAPNAIPAAPGSVIKGVMVRFTRHQREPSVAGDEEEDDAASLDSEYLRELQELVLEVPALVPVAGSDAAVQCKSPQFPSPCQTEIQIIVDGELLVSGVLPYAFYDPPQLHSVTPALIKLGGGDEVVIEGDGLFGCMLADEGWRDVAKEFMAKMEAEQAKAKKRGKKKKKKGVLAEPPTATRPEPSPDSKLLVRLQLLCEDELVDMPPLLVPGRYIAKFVEPEPLEDEESPFGDGYEEEEDGMCVAAVACKMPAVEVPPELLARLQKGEKIDLSFNVQIAISGDDFIPGHKVATFAAGVLDSSPYDGPVIGGTHVVLEGFGFIEGPELAVRLRTLNPPAQWIVTPKFHDHTRLSFITPEMKLPLPDSAAPAVIDDAASVATSVAGAGVGSGAGSVGRPNTAATGEAASVAEAGAEEGGDSKEGSEEGEAGEGKAEADSKDGEAEAAEGKGAEEGDAKVAEGGAEGAAGEGEGEGEGKAGGEEEDTPAPAPAPAPKPVKAASKKKGKKKAPQHPSFGNGDVFIDVAVREGDFFDTGRRLVVYGGKLAACSTCLGPMEGGTEVVISTPASEEWLYAASKPLVQVSNSAFALIVPATVTGAGSLAFTTPALPQPPPAVEGEEDEAGEAEEGKGEGEAEGEAEEADAKVEEGKVDTEPSIGPRRASVLTAVEVAGPVPRNVAFKVSLNGYAWQSEEFSFEYYNLQEAFLVDAVPPQATVGDTGTLTGKGWRIGSKAPMFVRVRPEVEGAKEVEGTPAVLEDAEADPESLDSTWKVTFVVPTITVPNPEAVEEEPKKKGKKKPPVRPVWFDLSFDGVHWFSTQNDEDVHIVVKDPPE